jgi:hypothetical protein
VDLRRLDQCSSSPKLILRKAAEMNEIEHELKRRLEMLEEALQRQDNLIIDLKALLVRAADALDRHNLDHLADNYDLIQELRKAAE